MPGTAGAGWGPIVMRANARPVLFIATLLFSFVLGFAGCGSDDAGFFERCSASDECPDGWVCPDPTMSGNGAIGHGCTPVCSSDADCKRITGRTDVECYNDFCIVDCTTSADCPASQPICRGANPSCEGQGLGQLWCATEDFSCF